ILASIITPMLVWAFFAGGFANAVGAVSEGSDARLDAYIIPGMASMTVLFSSIFSSISLIQDRQDGFLRASLVSPAPRWSIAVGKIGAGSIVALLQALIVLLALPFVGVQLTVLGVLGSIAALACISVLLIGIGLGLAWIVDSTQGFHGVMNAILMPLWLTSGAVFPVDNAAGWLRVIALLNPLTWSHTTMRFSLGIDVPTGNQALIAWTISIGAALAGALVGIAVIARGSRTP
ncbi:MAG: ABC transporter permease, partial [Phycisphaerales bacterium]|nr:ABC transporter permease [Phycisphaerales bacterium]